MPGRNGTGPFGEGPMTGRGNGPCGGGQRGFAGRGFRRGGMGRGNRGYGYWEQEATDEKNFLESIIGGLTRQLEYYRKRRNDLDES